MESKPNQWKDYLMLHFIVLIWGVTAILGKLITIPAVEVVFYRTLVAALGLGVLLLTRKRNFSIGIEEILKLVGTGFLIAAHWILFFAAARVSSVSVCLAGMATCSLWTSILEPLTSNKKIQLFEVLLSFLAIAGIVIIFRVEFDQKLGLLMAIGSAALAAIFSVLNVGFAKRQNPYMVTFYEMIGAFLSVTLFLPIYAKYFTGGVIELVPSNMDWAYLFILSIFCTVYAYSVSVELMKRLKAFVVNLTVNLEPVYGIIMALIIFGEEEEMSGGFYWGGALILVSVLLYPIINKVISWRKTARVSVKV